MLWLVGKLADAPRWRMLRVNYNIGDSIVETKNASPKQEKGVPRELSSEEQRRLQLVVACALPFNLDPDLVKFWEENPGALAWRIRQAVEKKVVTCTLDVWANEQTNTNDLVERGKYTEYNPLVNPLNFPIGRIYGHNEVKLEFIDVASVDVPAKCFDGGDVNRGWVTREDVLREASVRGLKQPTFIHALFFGKDRLAQFANGRNIVFLHEPQKISACECHPDWARELPSSGKGVIAFIADKGRRQMDLDSPDRFSANSLFPFVREKA